MEEVMATKVSSEFGTRRKRKPKARRARNSELAYGFDREFSSSVSKIVKRGVFDVIDYDISLYSRIGLHCYHFQEGTNFKFLSWEKYNSRFTCDVDFYIIFEAMDRARNSVVSFQTLFSDVGSAVAETYVIDWWRTFACRLRCADKALDEDWDQDKVIDKFYTGPMPKWLSDEALASHNKKYYVELVASPPLEINKVVVETKEDYIRDAREKLKAENAIFYISYKYKGVSSKGFTGDHQSIIRKTMDGRPGHMSLEVASELG